MSVCLITTAWTFHSWYRLMIRINRNTDLICIHDLMFDVNIVISIVNNSAISTSKIMKITAVRKIRDENSSRAELYGSNPHSNGNLFSRSSLLFLDYGCCCFCCCCFCFCCGSGGIVWYLFALYIKWSETVLFPTRTQTSNFHYVPKYYDKNIVLFTSRRKFRFVVRSAAATFRVTKCY